MRGITIGSNPLRGQSGIIVPVMTRMTQRQDVDCCLKGIAIVITGSPQLTVGAQQNASALAKPIGAKLGQDSLPLWAQFGAGQLPNF